MKELLMMLVLLVGVPVLMLLTAMVMAALGWQV